MDSFEQEVMDIDVGGRLRQLRQDRNMSMRALARASGLSTNALSMIERSRTSPSVSTLYKLAEALEVPITAFFRLEPPKQSVVYQKSNERRLLRLSTATWQAYGGDYYTGHLEPLLVTIDGGGNSGDGPMLHTGHEFVLCMDGKLEYEIAGHQYLLEPGDSLIFAAQLPHCWVNHQTEAASILIVLAGFEHGERPSEFHTQH